MIMTDDQGAWSRGRLMPELVTPALDELGATGRELTSFFCASPVCSPARASVLTGRMPSAHGVHDWIRCENSGIDTAGVRYLAGLDTTPQILAENGWTCAHSGKWHLGDARNPAPGFTGWFAHRDGGGPYYGAPVVTDGIEGTEPGYVTDAITAHAVALLTGLTSTDDPFYLQVHYTAPHTPWTPANHPDELLDLYASTTFPTVPREPAHPWFDTSDGALAGGWHDPLPALRGYCAALSGVDRGVAEILAALDRSGRREDTYLIFTSDNGFSCGHHGYWGKGNGTWPLNVWEPSITVPFVINRPGVLEPGLDDRLTSAVSLRPTILELAGVDDPPDPQSAGTSFAARLLGGDDDAGVAPAVVIFDEYGGTRMIRTDRHKYVHRFTGEHELYDLVADPGEAINLVDEPSSATLRDALHRQLTDWFAQHVLADRDAFAQPVSGLGQNATSWSSGPAADRYQHR